MSDERKATRQEPLSLSVSLPDGQEHTFLAHPMPWRKRNDVVDAQFDLYRAAVEQIGLQGKQFEAVFDYSALFELMFSAYRVQIGDGGSVDFTVVPPSNTDREAFAGIGFDEMLEVLGIGLEVNGFERLAWMLDPTRKKPPETGESESPPTSEQPKMEQPTDSGSPSPDETDSL